MSVVEEQTRKEEWWVSIYIYIQLIRAQLVDEHIRGALHSLDEFPPFLECVRDKVGGMRRWCARQVLGLCGRVHKRKLVVWMRSMYYMVIEFYYCNPFSSEPRCTPRARSNGVPGVARKDYARFGLAAPIHHTTSMFAAARLTQFLLELYCWFVGIAKSGNPLVRIMSVSSSKNLLHNDDCVSARHQCGFHCILYTKMCECAIYVRCQKILFAIMMLIRFRAT